MTEQADSPGTKSGVVVDLTHYRRGGDTFPVTFHRRELDAILRIYGRMVGEGEWKDYAIDHLREMAVFSIFKRSGEQPLYKVVKDPKLATKQGAFAVVNFDGRILKRGHELDQVLKVFDKVLKLVDK